MVTTNNSIIPVIAGITGLGNLPTVAAYQSLERMGQAKQLAMVAKAPQVAAERKYFESAVARMDDPEELLKDRRALNYLLTSYGLGSEANKTGIIEKVIKEDPFNKSSLVNALADSRWRGLAQDLNFHANGMGKLQGDIVTETFNAKTVGNRYLTVLKQNDLGEVTNTFYANNFGLTLASSGKLQTSDGLTVAGIRLDNLGNPVPAADTSVGYTADEMKAIQLNWLDNKKTPATTITPSLQLNFNQAVADPNFYSNVVTVDSPETDSNGNTVVAALTQTLTRDSGDTWRWVIKNGDTEVYNSFVTLTTDENGILTQIDGADATTKAVTLDWGGGETTEETMDLESLMSRSDFSQFVRVADTIGTDRSVRIDYNRISGTENRWEAKVWYADLGKLAATIDFRFNSSGVVEAAGRYDEDTGEIVGENDQTDATTATFTVDWNRSNGTSDLTLDFANIFSQTTINSATQDTKTDSVALGKRKSVDIDMNGVVSATYAKADGTGDTSVKLYRLATSTFDNQLGLQQFGTNNYSSAGADVGNTLIRPMGTDKDLLGNLVDGFSGQLAEKAKTTSSKTVMEILANGYEKNIYQQALGKENVALRYAVYFKENAGNIKSVYNILGDAALRDVFETVFSIPQRVATQPVTTQAAVFERKVDIDKFKDPKFVDQFIQRFLAMSGDTGTGGSGYQTGLLSGGGDILSAATSLVNFRV